jgi:hypothetical protein
VVEKKEIPMSDTVLILAPTNDLIPPDEVYELLAHDDVAIVEDDDEIMQYVITWADVTLHLEVLEGEEVDKALDEFQLAVDKLLDDRTDKKANKIRRRSERMERVLRCTVSPDWDDDRKAQLLVQGVMEFYDYAFMFANGTVYNENGNIEVGHEDSKPKYWEQEQEYIETEEATGRKKRSIDILKAEKVPYIVHLPAIADDEQVELRDTETVAKRALALYWITKRAEGESLDEYKQKIEQYQLQDVVTAEEWEFAENEEPADYLTIKFSRRLESYWLLLWALGFIHNLKRPDSFCNPAHAAEIISKRSAEQFIADAQLRSKEEILDAADLHYRYHWSIVDAELYGKKPPRGLEAPVVYERHYALNWLIQYKNQAWDEVTTDT